MKIAVLTKETTLLSKLWTSTNAIQKTWTEKCNQIKIHKYEHFKGVSSYGRTACYKNKLQANCKWDSSYSNGKTLGSKLTSYCWLWFSDFRERILKKRARTFDWRGKTSVLGKCILSNLNL